MPQNSKETNPKPFAAITLLAILFASGGGLRYLSLLLQSELLASFAGSLLFAPVSYVIVCLGWRAYVGLGQVLLAFMALIACFIAWNAIMLPGLPRSEFPMALQSNGMHWLLFLLCGWVSLQSAQWVVGIGIIAPSEVGLEPKPFHRNQLSLAKLLVVTCVCALLTEGWRRFALLGLGASSLPIRSVARETMLTGAVGGILLGLQWSILFWLRTAGSFRTAGVILWLALGVLIRWGLAISLAGPEYEIHVAPENHYYVIHEDEPHRPLDFATALRFLLETAVQTALVFAGFRFFAMLNLPIRFYREKVFR